MRILFESDNIDDIERGNIILLNHNVNFKSKLSIDLVKENHMFAVISTKPLAISPVSSKMRHVCDKYPMNIKIIDWKEAHLDKPSYINCSALGKIDKSDIYKIVGKLSRRDMNNIARYFLSGNAKLVDRIESYSY